MNTIEPDHWPFNAKTPGETYGKPPPEFRQVGCSHYMDKTIQPWDAMESWMTKVEFSGYLRGNVIKYVARWREKGGVQDLMKAQHYLEKLIELETESE